MVVFLRFLKSFKNEIVSLKKLFKEVCKSCLVIQSLGGGLSRWYSVIIQIFKSLSFQRSKVIRDHHVGRHSVIAEPHHTTSADGGKGGIFKSLHLEHNPDIWGKTQPFAIR